MVLRTVLHIVVVMRKRSPVGRTKLSELRVERLHQIDCAAQLGLQQAGRGDDTLQQQRRRRRRGALSVGSGTSGPWFHEVDAAAPGSTVKAEIPTSMSGKSLFVRVTTKCGTDTRSNVWNMGNIIAQKTETITLQGSSTPAGSGTGSSGGITVWLNGPSGITEATSSSTSGTALRCWPANAARARMRG